jgi:hypothetical protein
MTADTENGGLGWIRAIRGLAWGGAAFLLLLPLIAMQFTAEVAWGPEDFLVMGALLFTCAGMVDLASRRAKNLSYLFGIVIAVGASFLLIWINLAVGIIGSEDNPMNLMFFGVVLLTLTGAAIARFEAGGMARAMFIGAGALSAAGAITLFVGWSLFVPGGAVGILFIIAFFLVLWLLSAALFLKAAKRQKSLV